MEKTEKNTAACACTCTKGGCRCEPCTCKTCNC
jgi:hypothetical protein